MFCQFFIVFPPVFLVCLREMGLEIAAQVCKICVAQQVVLVINLKSATIIQYTIKGRFMNR